MRLAGHVREHSIDFGRVLVALRDSQRRQPGRGVVRVDPTHDGRNVAHVAGGRQGAKLQAQPADGGILRREFAGPCGQIQRCQFRSRRIGSESGTGDGESRGCGQRVCIRAGTEDLRGLRGPGRVFIGFRAGVRFGRGSVRGVGGGERKQQHTVLDHVT